MAMITRSEVRQVNTGHGRYYEVPTASGSVAQLPSVTRVLGALSKGPQLANWIAKTNRDAAVEAAAELYGEIAGTPPMSSAAFVSTLDQRMGKQRADERVLRKAGDIGTNVHKMVEWMEAQRMGLKVGKQPVLATQEATDAYASYVAWRGKVDLQPEALEMPVYSLKLGFAGTLDVYGRVDGKLAVVDWKTGKAVYNEAYLQNAAYCAAIQEMGLEPPEMGVIVRLPKMRGDSFEVVEIPMEHSIKYFGLFLKVLEMWRFLDAGPVEWANNGQGA